MGRERKYERRVRIYAQTEKRTRITHPSCIWTRSIEPAAHIYNISFLSSFLLSFMNLHLASRQRIIGIEDLLNTKWELKDYSTKWCLLVGVSFKILCVALLLFAFFLAHIHDHTSRTIFQQEPRLSILLSWEIKQGILILYLLPKSLHTYNWRCNCRLNV